MAIRTNRLGFRGVLENTMPHHNLTNNNGEQSDWYFYMLELAYYGRYVIKPSVQYIEEMTGWMVKVPLITGHGPASLPVVLHKL